MNTNSARPTGGLPSRAPSLVRPAPRRVPAVTYLVIAAVFFIPFGSAIDVVVSFGSAVAIVAVTRRSRVVVDSTIDAPTNVPATHNGAIVAPAIAIYAWVFGRFRLYSHPSELAVVVPGIIVLRASWRRLTVRAPGVEQPVDASLRPWVVIALTGCAWELITFFQQPSLRASSAAHPTLSRLVEELQRSHPGRASVIALWLAMGVGLVRR